jgi:predicted branched-subunit amino acid permease
MTTTTAMPAPGTLASPTADTDDDDPRCRRAVRPIRLATTDALTLLIGMVPFGLVVGVTAALLGITSPAALGTSAFLYAGTSQMAGFAQLAAGSAPLAVIATIVIVNARLLLYGAALESRFRSQPLWFRLIGPMVLIDQTFATATAKGPDPDRPFRRYWLVLGLTVLVGWTSSIAAGMIIGPALPTDLPLDATGTACLLGLLVPRLADRRALLTAAVAAVVAVAGLALPAGSGILLATSCGLLAGALVARKAETTRKAVS